MEDSSAFRPISVQTTRFKEPISFLEKEVVFNQLFSLLFSQWIKCVVSSLEFTSKLAASSLDILLNLISLFLCDSRTEWEFSNIPSNSDSGGLYHGSILLTEWWAVQFRKVHVANMFVLLSKLVVVFYDLIKELSKGIVRIMRSCIASNAWIDILAAWQNHLLETNSALVILVTKLVPNLFCQVLA